MNDKQQQLTFEKGITNVPSDALCSDNALEESLGMVYDNGEHRVIQKPKDYITSAVAIDGTTPISIQYINILYIHKFNDQERYVVAEETNNQGTTYYILIWGIKDGTVFKQKGTLVYGGAALTYSQKTKLTSIGKTLIVTDDAGLHYYIWSYDSDSYPIYNHIGDSLPTPNVEFKLAGVNDADNKVVAEGAKGSDWLLDNGSGTYTGVNPLHQNEWNNLIVGLHSKNKKDLHQKKRFWGTFAIRVALKMYDGTYAMVSNPILMFNQFQMPAIARIIDVTAEIGMRGQQLKYKKNSNLSDWKDLISEIVLFVSKEATQFDATSDAICEYYEPSGAYGYGASISGNIKAPVNSSVGSNDIYKVLNNIEDEGVKELVENGLFYKLCTIGLEQSTDWEAIDDFISTSTLENITTQEQLPEDDYFGHTEYKPSFLYAYNSRLNMANVSRSVFNGFSYFLPYDNYHLDGTTVVFDENTYDIYVKIATDSGERVVKKEFTTSQKQGIWFYYPDSRASHVTIYKEGDCILDAELKEHPALHGAYYFQGNLTTGDDEPGTISPPPQTALVDADVNNDPEILPNYIIQSEVNNPFVFKAAGYFKVGTGKIIGMSSITQALSEGQFGQYPLLVFSENGIWALSVASTGYYDSIRPMSREVCNNPISITQTDGAVFFSSNKGLMVVVSNQVKCVSEQMSGKTNVFTIGGTPLVTDLGNFCDFLKNAYIAYDYRDSLLWIFNGSYDACWVYSIKSGTFGKYDFGTGKKVTSVVNDYPDYLLQNSDGVLSLLQRPNINVDGTTSSNTFTPNTYNTKLITRPMKFENALALKSIMQIRHIKDFEPYTTTETISGETVTHHWPKTALRIFASNNMDHWAELPSLRGMPWKYYKFIFDFSGLKAIDRFSGTMLITQERRTNKMR